MPKLLKDDRVQLLRELRCLLAPYISRGKLFSSPEFLDMVEFVTETALTAGNYGYACQLVHFFEETPYQSIVIKWLEARAGLEIELTSTKVKMHKRATGIPLLVELAEYFPDAEKARNHRANALRIQQLESEGKVVRARTRVDLMDAGRRLPGSFESGKRR